MLNAKTIHSVSFPAARAAANAIATLHFGVVVQQVSIEDIPDDSDVWLPWAAVCLCSTCTRNLSEEDEDDWYTVCVLASEIAALRASGRTRMKMWPGIAAEGDKLASLLIAEVFDPREPLAGLSTCLKEQLSNPPQNSEILDATAEVKRLWRMAWDIVCTYAEEIEELTEILATEGYLDVDELRLWWNEVNALEAAQDA